jgi:enoyl-[acyl-carrier protein] reductase III
MADLKGKAALITGASRGIGRSVALKLASEGANILIHYRKNLEEASALEAELQKLGVQTWKYAADLSDLEQVHRVLGEIQAEHRRIDIFVANAAATAFRPMLEQKPHNLEKTFAISVHSFVAAVQEAAPHMAGGGRIVVVSGIDSHQAMAGHGVLGAAKAAMESLVRILALELGPRGITVNAVSPGLVDTESSRLYIEKGLGQRWDAAAARMVAATPVRRLGTVDDVASLVAYLASPAAGFLTGQTIILDGGLTIVSPFQRIVDAP